MLEFIKILHIVDLFKPFYKPLIDNLEAWNKPGTIASNISTIEEIAVEILDAVPGMTPAHSRDFKSARPMFSLRDGSVIKSYKNPIGVQHVFIANSSGHMVYGGYIEFWKAGYNYAPLYEALDKIKKELK